MSEIRLAMVVDNNKGKRTVKRPLVSDVVHQQDTHGAAVVRRRNGAETLLACGIPNLQLHTLPVELDGTDLEVDPDSGDERGSERVLAEAQKAAGFADAGVADEEEFDLGRG